MLRSASLCEVNSHVAYGYVLKAITVLWLFNCRHSESPASIELNRCIFVAPFTRGCPYKVYPLSPQKCLDGRLFRRYVSCLT